MERRNSSVPADAKQETVRRASTQPIDVSNVWWIAAPSVMMILLIVQLVLYRIADESMLVNIPFWCFFLWIWYTRPNTPEEDVSHSVDYTSMCLIVQIWIVYGVVAASVPVASIYLVRLYSILVLCAVILSFNDIAALRTQLRENIFISVMFSVLIFLPSPDAFAHSSHPFVMLWRVVFFCTTFVLSDCQTKLGKTVHIYGRRVTEASKIRDVQSVWILFCWQYSVFVGSIIEFPYLMWKVWSAILEKRHREEVSPV